MENEVMQKPGFDWYRIENETWSSLNENELKEVTVAGKQVGILKQKDKLHAFAAKCPHAGVPLCTGWLDVQGRIVCPKHKFRFDPANGRNTSGEGYKLYTYASAVRGNELWVYISVSSS